MLFNIFIVVGILFLLLGVFVYKFQKIEILSGYDSSKKYDREGLAHFIGKGFMYTGGLIIVSNLILMFTDLPWKEMAEIIIFIVLVFFFVIRAALKTPQYEIREKAISEDEKKFNKLVIGGIIGIALVIIVIIFGFSIAGYSSKTEVTVTGGVLEIKSGSISDDLNVSDIKEIYTKDTVPSFKREAGYSMDNVNKGKFKISGYGEGTLFLTSNKGPYIYIIAKDDIVILNNKDAAKTLQIYNDLKKLMPH